MQSLNEPEFKNKLNKIWPEKKYQTYWRETFRKVNKNQVDTWDYQWVYSIWNQNGLCINSKYNLIKNIGIGSGTHTTGKKNLFKNFKTQKINTNNYIKLPISDNNRDHIYYIQKYILKYDNIKKILKRLKIFNIIKSIYYRL